MICPDLIHYLVTNWCALQLEMTKFCVFHNDCPFPISELLLGDSRFLFIAAFLASLAFFFLVAAIYEGLKYFREVLHKFAMKKRKERKNKLETKSEVNCDLRYVQTCCVCLCVLLWV